MKSRPGYKPIQGPEKRGGEEVLPFSFRSRAFGVKALKPPADRSCGWRARGDRQLIKQVKLTLFQPHPEVLKCMYNQESRLTPGTTGWPTETSRPYLESRKEGPDVQTDTTRSHTTSPLFHLNLGASF